MVDLQTMQWHCDDILAISPCDAEYAEVSLKGHWITNEEEDCAGTFVCVLGDRPELLLEKVWQVSQNSIPVPEE